MVSKLSEMQSEDVPIVKGSFGVKAYVVAVVSWNLIISLFESIFMMFYTKPKSLRDKVCLITGSGRGLGRELCLELAKEGAIVACADINEQNNEITLAMVKKLGARAKAYKMNVASKEEVEDIIARIEDELGPIHLLVNNAAIVIEMKDPTEEFIRTLFNVNVLGSMWTTGAVVPRMNSRKDGHIVFISSAAAHYGCYPVKYYAATKAALTNFAQGLRIELNVEGSNIKVTTIHPYYMNTSKEVMDVVEERVSTVADMRDVLRHTVTAIKYEKADCYHPAIFVPFLPPKAVSRVYKFSITSTKLPSEKEYLDSRNGAIIKACNSQKVKKI